MAEQGRHQRAVWFRVDRLAECLKAVQETEDPGWPRGTGWRDGPMAHFRQLGLPTSARCRECLPQWADLHIPENAAFQAWIRIFSHGHDNAPSRLPLDDGIHWIE